MVADGDWYTMVAAVVDDPESVAWQVYMYIVVDYCLCCLW